VTYINPRQFILHYAPLDDGECYKEASEGNQCSIDIYPYGCQLSAQAFQDLKADTKTPYEINVKYCPGLLYEMLHNPTSIRENIILEECGRGHVNVRNGRHRICIANKMPLPSSPLMLEVVEQPLPLHRHCFGCNPPPPDKRVEEQKKSRMRRWAKNIFRR
jgi:hypothetical protein